MFRRVEPPRIHVGVKRVGKEWILSIQDNGLGIEDEYFERIFESSLGEGSTFFFSLPA